MKKVSVVCAGGAGCLIGVDQGIPENQITPYFRGLREDILQHHEAFEGLIRGLRGDRESRVRDKIRFIEERIRRRKTNKQDNTPEEKECLAQLELAKAEFQKRVKCRIEDNRVILPDDNEGVL